MLVSHVQKVDHLTDGGVFENEHMLRENLNESEEATLCVVPRIGVNLNRAFLVPSSGWAQVI